MGEEQIAQVAISQATNAFTAGAFGEPNASSDLFNQINDGRPSLANLNDEEVALIRLLKDMYEDYKFFGIMSEADYCIERITTIIETSKGRRGAFLNALVSKQLKIDVGAGTPPPKTWRTRPNYQEQQR